MRIRSSGNTISYCYRTLSGNLFQRPIVAARRVADGECAVPSAAIVAQPEVGGNAATWAGVVCYSKKVKKRD